MWSRLSKRRSHRTRSSKEASTLGCCSSSKRCERSAGPPATSCTSWRSQRQSSRVMACSAPCLRSEACTSSGSIRSLPSESISLKRDRNDCKSIGVLLSSTRSMYTTMKPLRFSPSAASAFASSGLEGCTSSRTASRIAWTSSIGAFSPKLRMHVVSSASLMDPDLSTSKAWNACSIWCRSISVMCSKAARTFAHSAFAPLPVSRCSKPLRRSDTNIWKTWAWRPSRIKLSVVRM
mmetsp:Transcript_73735/g.205084  ORF Transcript_73735/g.205084 Transcript_73735/m.205084 type:complete len:235 (-) Transcript_73735:518-1222(-)